MCAALQLIGPGPRPRLGVPGGVLHVHCAHPRPAHAAHLRSLAFAHTKGLRATGRGDNPSKSSPWAAGSGVWLWMMAGRLTGFHASIKFVSVNSAAALAAGARGNNISSHWDKT